MDTVEKKLKEMKQNLQEKGKRPIFFIGSGLSRRYLNSPDWKSLLEEIAKKANCDYKKIVESCNGEYEMIAQELEYYCFRNIKEEGPGLNIESHRELLRGLIAQIFNKYKEEYKENAALEKCEGFKREINRRLVEIEQLNNLDKAVKIQEIANDYDDIAEKINKHSDNIKKLGEIEELRKISPKAIITTNYDTLLEDIIFENRCRRHIGQEGFSDNQSASENKIDLYKIHGCVTKPESIIITKEDYDQFFQKSKYLYSKILTLFWEYPVIFIGYSVSDRNIRDILAVMIEIMTEEQKQNFLRHIWIVDFVKHEEEECGTDKEIELANGAKIQIPCIRLTYYYKLYEAINEVVLNQHFGDLNFTISENVIELLIEPLYQQQNKLKVVVRELLQNALDACKKKGVSARINIRVEDSKGRYLEIKDNGIGMDLQEIKDNLLTVGKSSKTDSCEGLVGKYGIGILSVFLIGKHAEVYTKKDGNALLALKIYIQNDKKQVDWLTNITDDIRDKKENSFTVVRIYLKDDLEIPEKENYMEILGLESYVTKSENSIMVNYLGKQCKAPEMINEFEWLETLSDNIKLYKLDYSDKDTEQLNDDEKKLKKIMDTKGLVLYNDMISRVEYNKMGYRQLNHIDIPFLILDMKKTEEAEKDVKTNLSRSVLQISGDVMRSVAKGMYRLEIDKIMDVIGSGQAELEKSGWDIYALLKNIRNSSDILKYDVDVMIKAKKLYFSKTEYWNHIRVWGKEETAKKFLKDFSEPVLYYEGRLDKSNISDIIEEKNLICISYNYLESYVFHATSQHNGLRKQALIRILNLLGENQINENKWIKQIWDHIKANREQLIGKCREKLSEGALWLNDAYNKNDIDVNGEYFVVYESKLVERYMDDDFCEILQNFIKDEPLSHIVGIHKE